MTTAPKQITKKAIPKRIQVWQRELNGWRKFIKDAKKASASEGKEWTDKMVTYARQRIDDLLNFPPVRRNQARAAAARKRVKRG